GCTISFEVRNTPDHPPTMSDTITGLRITGTLSPDATGDLEIVGAFNGKIAATSDGSSVTPPSGPRKVVAWLVPGVGDPYWSIALTDEFGEAIGEWISTEDVATPDLV